MSSAADAGRPGPGPSHLLLPLLSLPDVCLFPESSLALMITSPPALRALELAMRAGRQLLAVAQKEPGAAPGRDLHGIGTVAQVSEDVRVAGGAHRVELDGLRRARLVTLLGVDTPVAEAELLDEGDPGDEWGSAVEALARYLHSHAELRSFLDGQRRSTQPMAWVNLACQHLPITPSARQRLLEAGAGERCQKIGRGLDALLRKEQGA